MTTNIIRGYEEVAKTLASLIQESVKKNSSGLESAAVAFSGGLDSSVVAYVLQRFCPATLYTAGLPGSHDIVSCTTAANLLGIPLRIIKINIADITPAARDICHIADTTDPVRVSFLLPIYFVCKECVENNVFTGQGADELFGGYHRYLEMNLEELGKNLKEDTENAISKGSTFDRASNLRFNKTIRNPFLEPEVRDYAYSIPPSMKIQGGIRKNILRECARLMGLPDFLAGSQKKAAQYSSGIMKEIQKLAKKDEKTVSGWLESISLETPG